MKFLAALLLITFVSLAVFGFVSIGHADHGNAPIADCLASKVAGKICPENETPLSGALFHLKAFSYFSTALFGQIGGVLALMLFAFLLVGKGFLSGLELSAVPVSRQSVDFREIYLRSIYGERRFLSRFENSPSPF